MMGAAGGNTQPVGPTLVNIGDAAPDRIVALTFKVTSIKLNQSGGGTVDVLQGTAPTVETSHLDAAFAPINFTTTSTSAATYDGVTIGLATPTVTFIDDAGAVQQDAAPTLNGGGSYTVTFASPVVLTGSAPSVLDLELDPTSVTIDTLTNKATITPTFTATLAAPAAVTAQKDSTGGVLSVIGKVTSDPVSGSNQFKMTFSQASQPILINVDSSTVYFNQVNGFGAVLGGNIVEIGSTLGTNGQLLAFRVDGLNAGAGKTTGAALEGVLTSVTYTSSQVSAASLRLQNANGNGTLPSAGSNVPLTDFTLPPTFTVDIGSRADGTADVDLTNVSTQPSLKFDINHVQPAQEVAVIYANGSVTTKPDSLRLREQTLSGTVNTVSNGEVAGQQIIDLVTPTDSFFNTLTCATVIPGCQTHLKVIQQPSTDISLAGPSPGNPIRVRGLLFWDDVGNSYILVASRFAP